MSYADTLLASGERIVLRQHQHPFMLAWNARYSIVAIIIAAIGLLLRLISGDPEGIGGALAGGAAALAGGVKAINAAANFEQTQVAFTTLIGDAKKAEETLARFTATTNRDTCAAISSRRRGSRCPSATCSSISW